MPRFFQAVHSKFVKSPGGEVIEEEGYRHTFWPASAPDALRSLCTTREVSIEHGAWSEFLWETGGMVVKRVSAGGADWVIASRQRGFLERRDGRSFTHAHFWFLPEDQWDWRCLRALWNQRTLPPVKGQILPDEVEIPAETPDGPLPARWIARFATFWEGIISGSSTGTYVEKGDSAVATALDEICLILAALPDALANRLSLGLCMGTCPSTIALSFGAKLETEVRIGKQVKAEPERLERGKPYVMWLLGSAGQISTIRNLRAEVENKWARRLAGGSAPADWRETAARLLEEVSDELWLTKLRAELQAGDEGEPPPPPPASFRRFLEAIELLWGNWQNAITHRLLSVTLTWPAAAFLPDRARVTTMHPAVQFYAFLVRQGPLTPEVALACADLLLGESAAELAIAELKGMLQTVDAGSAQIWQRLVLAIRPENWLRKWGDQCEELLLAKIFTVWNASLPRWLAILGQVWMPTAGLFVAEPVFNSQSAGRLARALRAAGELGEQALSVILRQAKVTGHPSNLWAFMEAAWKHGFWPSEMNSLLLVGARKTFSILKLEDRLSKFQLSFILRHEYSGELLKDPAFSVVRRSLGLGVPRLMAGEAPNWSRFISDAVAREAHDWDLAADLLASWAQKVGDEALQNGDPAACAFAQFVLGRPATPAPDLSAESLGKDLCALVAAARNRNVGMLAPAEALAAHLNSPAELCALLLGRSKSPPPPAPALTAAQHAVAWKDLLACEDLTTHYLPWIDALDRVDAGQDPHWTVAKALAVPRPGAELRAKTADESCESILRRLDEASLFALVRRNFILPPWLSAQSRFEFAPPTPEAQEVKVVFYRVGHRAEGARYVFGSAAQLTELLERLAGWPQSPDWTDVVNDFLCSFKERYGVAPTSGPRITPIAPITPIDPFRPDRLKTREG